MQTQTQINFQSRNIGNVLDLKKVGTERIKKAFKKVFENLRKGIDELIPSCETTMRELVFNSETKQYEWVITFHGRQDTFLRNKNKRSV
jgi:hypothetical protein